MSTIAELVIKVNTTELDRAKKSLEDLAKSTEALDASSEKSSRTRKRASEQVAQVLEDEAAILERAAAADKERARTATTSASTVSSGYSKAAQSLNQYDSVISNASAAQDRLKASTKAVVVDLAAERQAYRSLVASIDPATAALQKLEDQQRELNAMRARGRAGTGLGIDPAEYTRLNNQIEASRKRIVDLGATTGKTAKEMNFALRGLPAQFTDIVVSLQGGQAPLTVLLQQGGQIKDMFGGIGPALKAMTGYVVGLINPFTLLVAAMGTLGFAYYSGSKEADTYRLALVSTGNAAGTTTNELANMATSVGNITGSVGKAAQVLGLLANNTKIDVSSFERVTEVIVGWSKVSGVAVEDLVSQFSEIAKSPLENVVKLNEKYNFLTADVYKQIAALEEQNKTQEAGTVATNAFADSLDSRSTEMVQNLGYIEGGWKNVTSAILGSWDALKGIGRVSTDQQLVEGLDKTLATMHATEATLIESASGDGIIARYNKSQLEAYQKKISLVQQEREEIIDRIEDEKTLAWQEQYTNKIREQGYKAAEELDKKFDRTKSLTGYRKELEELDKAYVKMQKADIIDAQQQIKYNVTRADLLKKIKKEEEAGSKVRLEAAERILNSLKQQEAALNDQAEANGKITKEASALAKLRQQFADIEEKQKTSILSKEQKSLLVNKEAILAQAEKNVKISQEIKDKQTLLKLDTLRDQLSAKYAANQEKYEDAVIGVGRGKRAVEQMRERNALQREYTKEVAKLAEEFRKSAGSPADKQVYEEGTRLLKESLDKNLELLEENYGNMEAAQANWMNGATAAWEDYLDGIRDVSGQMYSIFTSALKGLEDYLVSFITGTKASFKDMVKSIAADLARLAVRNTIGGLFGINTGNSGGGGLLSGISSLLGGGGNSSGGGGGGFGSLVSIGKNIYSIYNAITGIGADVAAGYASGGFSGAASAGLNYYGSMLTNAYSTIASWFGSTATSAATTAASQAAANVGYGIGQNLVTGVVGQSVTAGAASGSGGALSSALGSLGSMWYIAPLIGMIQSGKLFDQGVRADEDALNQQFGGSGLSQLYGKLVGGQANLNSKVDGLIATFVGDKAAAIITGSPVVQALASVIGKALGLGGGEQFKRTVGSATGMYSGGEYTGTGAQAGWFEGARTFGEDFDKQLHGINEAFATTLGGLFDMFDIESDIMTSSAGRLRRTSGRLAAEFTAEFEGQVVTIMGQYGKRGNIQDSLKMWFDDVMGRGIVEAISASSLPEYLKELTTGLTGAENVANTINELFYRFNGMNDVLESLRLTTFSLTDAGLRASDSLLNMVAAVSQLEDPTVADKLKALGDLTATYYDQFFTEAEKQEDIIKGVTKTFEGLNKELPTTRQGFRDIVDGLDLTTAAGQSMFFTLMVTSGQVATYFDVLDARAQQAAQAAEAALAIINQAQAALMSNASSAFGMVQRSVSAERDRITQLYNQAVAAQQAAGEVAANAAQERSKYLQELASKSQEVVRSLQSLGKALSSALDTLLGGNEEYVAAQREASLALLRTALASGKNLSTFEGLEDALTNAADLDSSVYSSLIDFEREQGRTANLIASLQALNGKQLTAEEKLLTSLQAQSDAAQKQYTFIGSNTSQILDNLKAQYDKEIEKLDEDLKNAQLQMDALNGIDNSILNVGVAIERMSAAVVAAINGQASIDQGKEVKGNASAIDNLYKSILGYGADTEGQKFWQNALDSGTYTYNDLIKGLRAQAAKDALSSTPKFASGGSVRGEGTGTSDSILAFLSNGEFVVNAKAASAYGTDYLHAMNTLQAPKLASGGSISVANSPSAFIPTQDDKDVAAMLKELTDIKDLMKQSNKNTGNSEITLRQISQMSMED